MSDPVADKEPCWCYRCLNDEGDPWVPDPDLSMLVENDVQAAVAMLKKERPKNEFFVIGKQVYESYIELFSKEIEVVMVSEWRIPDR